MCSPTISREDVLSERLFQGTIHALELFGVYIGKRLGLYELLREHGSLTVEQLAQRAEIHPRYAQEWLEQQAVGGFLQVSDVARPPLQRLYTLPRAHVNVLAEPDAPAHVAPFAQMLVGIAGALPKVVDAYRTGGGVAYADYGPDFRAGQGGINRPSFTHDLPTMWLGALPTLAERLAAGQPLHIADVGCGEGWACLALARAFPAARVVGLDLDAASIAAAEEQARQAGVEVEFHCGDASHASSLGRFDLVLLLETLHDLPEPVVALEHVRAALRPDGCVVVADERVAEHFVAPGDELERMMYGWSISHCLPTSMAHPGSAALGTALRPEMVEQLSRAAGFGSCERLSIPNDLFRFWRLGA